MNKTLRLALSAAIACCASLAISAHAEDAGNVTFKVPYKFSNIPLTKYESFRIMCYVFATNSSAPTAFASSNFPLDSNGGASGTAEIIVKSQPGKSLSDSTGWRCQADFNKKDGTADQALLVAKPGTQMVEQATGKF